MVRALVEQLAIETGPRLRAINVLPALLSPADLRYLREIVVGFGVEPIILPDYSQTSGRCPQSLARARSRSALA